MPPPAQDARGASAWSSSAGAVSGDVSRVYVSTGDAGAEEETVPRGSFTSKAGWATPPAAG